MSRSDRAPLLVRIPNWLGDLILALPVLESAVAAGPAVFVGPEPFRSLLAPRFPAVRYIATSRARRWAAADAIREARPRAALLLTDSLSSALLVWLAGVPERIGYAAEGRTPWLTRRVARSGSPRSAPRAAEYRVLAAAAGLPEPAAIPALEPLPEELERAREILSGAGLGGSGYLVVAPGASYGPAKQWEAVRFVQAASQFALRSSLAIVVVGAAEDRPSAAAVAEGVQRAGARAVDLAGSTQLPDLVGVLAGSAAVISNDSGVMHLAAALRRPTVAIFGSTSPVWTSASVPWVANLYAAYPCSPCFRRTCPIGYGCLLSITPADAGAALERLVP